MSSQSVSSNLRLPRRRRVSGSGRPLVRRRWRRESPSPARRECLPGPTTTSVTTNRSGFDSGPLPVPSCPASFVKGLAKPPPCRLWMSLQPTADPYTLAHGASVPDVGASPQRLQNAPASRKRHFGVGNHQLWLPRQHWIPAGCLVFQSVGVAQTMPPKGGSTTGFPRPPTRAGR
ncbi:MAG: hypothetical protein OXC84_10450 [Gammaproteobacteria bacterium]|nr:hypothetical protein [Gammaproteobacteria bacterium]